MKKRIGAIAVTIIVGTLLHFTYQWSGQNVWVSTFSAVNESTWEHLKLLFFPFILWAVITYFVSKQNKACFWYGKLFGVMAGMSTIVIGFYTITGIIGGSLGFVNILLYCIGVIVAFKVDSLRTERCLPQRLFSETTCILLIILMTILFIWFTFAPPAIGLFRSPV